MVRIAHKSTTNDSLYVNGTLALSENGKPATIAQCRDTGNVGRGYNDNTYFPGDIAEVLVYNRALSVAERQQVDGYAQARFFATPPPWLNFSAGGGQHSLSWSVALEGYELESATNLDGAAWSVVTNTPSTVGEEYRLTPSITTDTVFYRLKK